MHNSSKGSAYLVWSRTLLAEVMEDAVKHQYHSSLRAGWDETNRQVERASRRKGQASAGRLSWLPAAATVDYSTAWRARHGKSEHVKGSTFSWLTLFVGQDRCGRLEEAVVSPLAQWLIAEQEAWERREFARQVQDPDRSLLKEAAYGASRDRRFGDLLLEMLKANPEVLLGFHNRTRAHREQRTNVVLAELVAPFRDASPQNLERTWEEMGQADRKEYVRLTLLRAELLLRRSLNRQRAWEVSARILKRPTTL